MKLIMLIRTRVSALLTQIGTDGNQYWTYLPRALYSAAAPTAIPTTEYQGMRNPMKGWTYRAPYEAQPPDTGSVTDISPIDRITTKMTRPVNRYPRMTAGPARAIE